MLHAHACTYVYVHIYAYMCVCVRVHTTQSMHVQNASYTEFHTKFVHAICTVWIFLRYIAAECRTVQSACCLAQDYAAQFGRPVAVCCLTLLLIVLSHSYSERQGFLGRSHYLNCRNNDLVNEFRQRTEDRISQMPYTVLSLEPFLGSRTLPPSSGLIR